MWCWTEGCNTSKITVIMPEMTRQITENFICVSVHALFIYAVKFWTPFTMHFLLAFKTWEYFTPDLLLLMFYALHKPALQGVPVAMFPSISFCQQALVGLSASQRFECCLLSPVWHHWEGLSVKLRLHVETLSSRPRMEVPSLWGLCCRALIFLSKHPNQREV